MPPDGGLGERSELHPRELLEALGRNEVAYVIVGGVAAMAHGVQRITRDLDIIIDRGRANCRRLIAALVELDAEIHSPGQRRRRKLSAKADPAWIGSANRFFDTRAGGLDVWNRSTGMPSFRDARGRAIKVEVFGVEVLVLDRDSLIRSKLAAGREKDLADVAELGEPPGEGSGARNRSSRSSSSGSSGSGSTR